MLEKIDAAIKKTKLPFEVILPGKLSFSFVWLKYHYTFTYDTIIEGCHFEMAVSIKAPPLYIFLLLFAINYLSPPPPGSQCSLMNQNFGSVAVTWMRNLQPTLTRTWSAPPPEAL